MITSVKLVDGSSEFVFQDPSLGNNDDVTWTHLNVGSPEIRKSVTNRVSSDGTYDRTKYHGARAVTLECRLASSPAAKVDYLSRFLHPSRRPELVVTDDDWHPSARRIVLVSDQWTPADLTHTSSWFRDVSLQWTAPLGVWEGFELHEYSVDLSSGSLGRSYPLVSPRVYPATGSVGVFQFDNPGNGRSDWVARLYGPCVGPRLTNDATGEAVVFFSSLTLNDNEYIELSSADLTAYAMSNQSLSRLHHLDFAESSWWKVEPGLNMIRYNPTSGVDDGCRAEFEFRPTWL